MGEPSPCGSHVCVVMPVYNEAGTVAGVLDAVRSHFDGPVVVVDDGSQDETRELVSRRTGVELVCHDGNLGYGASLKDGFAEALRLGAEAVISMDCDGQHEPLHIPEFCGELTSSGADIISGSRYLPESQAVGEAPPDRRDINRRVTSEIARVTGWSITDAFCGFKAYHCDALRRITTTEPGYGMPLEIWAKAWRAGLTIRELPVERVYFDHDRSFGQDLDEPEKRFAYYMRVWRRALEEKA